MQKKYSWKTSLFGSIFAASTGLAASEALPENARGYAGLVAALSGILAAFFTRDNNVSSEQAGAK